MNAVGELIECQSMNEKIIRAHDPDVMAMLDAARADERARIAEETARGLWPKPGVRAFHLRGQQTIPLVFDNDTAVDMVLIVDKRVFKFLTVNETDSTIEVRIERK